MSWALYIAFVLPVQRYLHRILFMIAETPRFTCAASTPGSPLLAPIQPGISVD